MKKEVTYHINRKDYTLSIDTKGLYYTTLGGVLALLNIIIRIDGYTQIVNIVSFLLLVIGFSIVNKSLGIIVTIASLSFYLLLLVLDKIS